MEAPNCFTLWTSCIKWLVFAADCRILYTSLVDGSLMFLLLTGMCMCKFIQVFKLIRRVSFRDVNFSFLLIAVMRQSLTIRIFCSFLIDVTQKQKWWFCLKQKSFEVTMLLKLTRRKASTRKIYASHCSRIPLQFSPKKSKFSSKKICTRDAEVFKLDLSFIDEM